MAHLRQHLVDAEFDMAKEYARRIAVHLERMRVITEQDIRSASIPVEVPNNNGGISKWVIQVDFDSASNAIVLQVPGRDN